MAGLQARPTSGRTGVFVGHVGIVAGRMAVPRRRPKPSLASVAADWRCRAIASELPFRRFALPTRPDDSVRVPVGWNAGAFAAGYAGAPAVITYHVTALHAGVALPARAGILAGHCLHVYWCLSFRLHCGNNREFVIPVGRFANCFLRGSVYVSKPVARVDEKNHRYTAHHRLYRGEHQ